MIDEIAKLIEENPNDAVLGRKLRDLHHNNHDNLIVLTVNLGKNIKVDAYHGINTPDIGARYQKMSEALDFISKNFNE